MDTPDRTESEVPFAAPEHVVDAVDRWFAQVVALAAGPLTSAQAADLADRAAPCLELLHGVRPRRRPRRRDRPARQRRARAAGSARSHACGDLRRRAPWPCRGARRRAVRGAALPDADGVGVRARPVRRPPRPRADRSAGGRRDVPRGVRRAGHRRLAAVPAMAAVTAVVTAVVGASARLPKVARATPLAWDAAVAPKRNIAPSGR
jgi:hypothetical protein